MPKIQTNLTEKEVKQAIAYWVIAGCPLVDADYMVSLNADRPANANQFDCGNGVTANVFLGKA